MNQPIAMPNHFSLYDLTFLQTANIKTLKIASEPTRFTFEGRLSAEETIELQVTPMSLRKKVKSLLKLVIENKKRILKRLNKEPLMK